MDTKNDTYISHFDVKQPDFDWEAVGWRYKEWSARYRDLRNALKDARTARYVDPLRLLSVACEMMLTDRVIYHYVHHPRGWWRTRDDVIDSLLSGRPTPARLRELILVQDGTDIKDVTRAANNLVESLVDAGLLTRSAESIDLSQAGVSFGSKSLMRAMTRPEIEKLLDRVLERAEAFNADDSNLYRISLVAVFGSYLDSREDKFGDLDVAYAVERSTPPDEVADWDAWLAEEYEHHFGEPYSVIDELHRGFRRYQQLTEGRVIRALRANNRVSLHPLGHEGIFVKKPELPLGTVYACGKRVSSDTVAGRLLASLNRSSGS